MGEKPTKGNASPRSLRIVNPNRLLGVTRALGLLFLTAMAVAVMTSCAELRPAARDIGDRQSCKRVLVATEQSQFKERLVGQITETLRDEAYFVRLIDVGRLADESSLDYGAIVVVNTCRAWQLDRNVRQFLQHLDDHEKEKIVLLTTRSGSWTPQLVGVDALTSASEVDRIPALAAAIVANIRQRMAGRGLHQGTAYSQ